MNAQYNLFFLSQYITIFYANPIDNKCVSYLHLLGVLVMAMHFCMGVRGKFLKYYMLRE